MKKYLAALFLLLSCAQSNDKMVDIDASMDVADIADAPLDTARPKDSGAMPGDAGVTNGSFDLWPPGTSNVYYHGGPVMSAPINIYFIWYGYWEDIKTVNILEDLVSNIGNSAYFQTNSVYYELMNGTISDAGSDAAINKFYVSTRVSFIQSIFVGHSYGDALSSSTIVAIVKDAITSNSLPLDPNGVYYVLTSKDVSEGPLSIGFCTSYCGYHFNFLLNDVNVKYSFVGDTDQCPNACTVRRKYVEYNIKTSPNDNWSADGMASIMIHELSEIATDPIPDDAPAWQDGFEEEVADLCAYVYGNLYETNNGSVANVPIGRRNYLLQKNWTIFSDGGQGCALHQ